MISIDIGHCSSGYGFVEFLSEEDADYAIKIMNMIIPSTHHRC